MREAKCAKLRKAALGGSHHPVLVSAFPPHPCASACAALRDMWCRLLCTSRLHRLSPPASLRIQLPRRGSDVTVRKRSGLGGPKTFALPRKTGQTALQSARIPHSSVNVTAAAAAWNAVADPHQPRPRRFTPSCGSRTARTCAPHFSPPSPPLTYVLPRRHLSIKGTWRVGGVAKKRTAFCKVAPFHCRRDAPRQPPLCVEERENYTTVARRTRRLREAVRRGA